MDDGRSDDTRVGDGPPDDTRTLDVRTKHTPKEDGLETHDGREDGVGPDIWTVDLVGVTDDSSTGGYWEHPRSSLRSSERLEDGPSGV